MAFKSKVTSSLGLVGSPSTITPTVGSGQEVVLIGLSFANKESSNITVSAKLIKADTSEAFIVKDATVLPGGALVAVGGDQKLALEQGDSVTAYASLANSADVILSYLV